MSGTLHRAGAGLAIVTGASSGIGAEFARQLAAAGRPVLAVARRRDCLEALATEARTHGWAAIHPLAVDLTSPEATSEIVRAADALGGAAWLVNDAGVNSFGPFVDAPAVTSTALVRLNCESLVSLTGAVLPGMLARKSGVIVNVSSVAGFMATPLMAVYGASKAFVLSYSEAVREELRGTGVSVTALCPGPVATGLYELVAPGIARAAPTGQITAAACARFGIDAASRGVAVAIPGLFNRLNVLGAMLAPRAVLRRFLHLRGLSYLGYPSSSFKRLP